MAKAKSTFEIEWIDPKTVHNHLLNLKLYGSGPDPELQESIKQGWMPHKEICYAILDGKRTVVDGHRRRASAVANGDKTAPFVHLAELDEKPLEIERYLILSNRYRIKTMEQKAREYEELTRIEAGLAEQRMKAGKPTNTDPGENVPQGPHSTKQGAFRAPRAKEIAATDIGMSYKTADKALEVVHTADELRAAGDVEKADTIIAALNTKPVAAAVRAAAAATAPPDTKQTEDQQHSQTIDRATSKLVGIMQQAEKTLGEMFVAIDQKKTSPAFANRHAKFAGLIRRFGELLDPLQHHAGAMDVQWKAARKQCDE